MERYTCYNANQLKSVLIFNPTHRFGFLQIEEDKINSEVKVLSFFWFDIIIIIVMNIVRNIVSGKRGP